MARPIAETPILTGEDAERFVQRMQWVDSLTREQREENSRKLNDAIAQASRTIKICL